MYFTKSRITKENYLSLLLALFPISFIAGNMVINLNLSFFLISAIIFFNKKILNLKLQVLDKLIIIFFLFLICNGFISDYNFRQSGIFFEFYPTLIKSIFFSRFLILYFILRYLIENNILKLKLFFLSSAICSIFVSFDIFYQFVNGEDIFGYQIISSGRKLGGPFGDELIAGSFLQRFSLFSFFLVPVLNYQKFNKLSKYLTPVLFSIFIVGIILSGNRMPLLLFVLVIFLIILFEKDIRKYLIHLSSIFIIIFLLLFNFNTEVKYNFKSFYTQISKMKVTLIDKNFDKNEVAPYMKEFISFYDTWLMNKYIGGGIKNFRYNCHLRQSIKKENDFKCNMHPHNYYLEILTETGILGFILLTTIFLIVLKKSFYNKYFKDSYLKNRVIVTPFLFLFFAEFFPFRSSGSFFTTGNATYFFLILSILISLVNKYYQLKMNNKYID